MDQVPKSRDSPLFRQVALQRIVRIRMDHRLKLNLLENGLINFETPLSTDSRKQALSNNTKFEMVSMLSFEVPPLKLFC